MTGVRASVADQEKLLDILELDTEVIRIRRAQAESRDALLSMDGDARYLELVREAADLSDLLDENGQDIARTEEDIRIARERIDRDRQHELRSTDTKELTSLEHEIASLDRRIDSLTDALAELTTARSELLDRHAVATTQRDHFHAERDRRHGEIVAEGENLERRLDQIAVERDAIVSALPGDLVALYERQRERYGVGASRLVGAVTTASGVSLTEGQIQEIRSANPEDVVLCPVSDAILVRTGGSSN